MNHLTFEQKAFWSSYLESLPAHTRPIDPNVHAAMAGTPNITDELLALYLSGRKSAGSSLLEDYISAGDPPPSVGDYWIYLDSRGHPRAILKTERIERHKFKEVPVSVAVAEGEGDLSLEHWRKAHGELYAPYLSEWGLKELGNATIITEYFTIVFRENASK